MAVKWPLIILGVLLLIAVYYGVGISRKLATAKELIRDAVPFTIGGSDTRSSLLVLGDSTAVGVGAATSSESVAGRVAMAVGATYVEHYGVSGARTHDLRQQIAQAKLASYTYVLIEIGANDIIRFYPSKRAAAELREALDQLPDAQRVVVHSAGNVGGVSLFPFFVRPFHRKLTLAYHKAFEDVVTAAGARYVNMYTDPKADAFVQQQETYIAADSLHPTSAGYALWAEKLLPAFK